MSLFYNRTFGRNKWICPITSYNFEINIPIISPYYRSLIYFKFNDDDLSDKKYVCAKLIKIKTDEENMVNKHT